MLKRYLLAPGPTPVPPEVLLAMAKPVIHHRAPEFAQLFGEVRNDLRWLFQTGNDVLILASSGTGGMEGAVASFLSPGDKALVVNGGKFGERWGKICKTFGVQVVELKVEWGYAVDPQAVADALKKDPSIKAVYVQASETSTGVAHPTKRLAEVIKPYEGTILVVDAITALGVFDLKTDAWGLDVVVAGSQKAMMLPPGLAFVSVSDKAWQLADKAKNGAFYFNLKKERESQTKNQTAYTPAVSMILGLQEVLRMLKAEGLDAVFARHARLAHAMREGVKAAGLSLFPKESPSDALTAISAPGSVDGQAIYKNLRVQYGITAAGGQDHLKGKIFRVSHMGYMDTFDVILTLAAIEMVLKGLGHPVKLGSGVAKAQELLMAKG
ncbi:MAG: alanine--glyoxylate aminotransferase family protein [Nitrospirae bacterium]|nr:MAG: class V aminotransferase [Nitrospirae bacterium 13_2_20CM_2_62_8]OLB99832.1 MAG: class V aminotransferase [Nitrospirae bacterium 13_1_40CM_62_7]OLC42810.1 MAG: class V aminotransferase [Nitrospirae bacterium 13_1_40CM_4_62_6]OLC80383.1 MAG: class V aminotransferase [Nitrospirae bacterium 13_1_40CM_3_62_11]OLD38076.1 MAG: class V aminotransferase [Nitrospirae bacterium 13_1_40CM_2_62_10]TLY43509.1 MAG: alanine--glyoxylate aminotransferase family protein [Nitrospirota bacterium]